MCTLSVKMDDKVIDRVKPLFGGDKAMNRWIEAVLHKALEEYADLHESNMKNASEAEDKEIKRIRGGS